MTEVLKPKAFSFGTAKRKIVSFSPRELVRTEYLESGRSLPLVIRPQSEGVSLVGWARDNREFVEAQLVKHGAILFRDFPVSTVSRFEQFIGAVSAGLLEYRERSSPRSRVSGNVYTSTDHPADQSIFLHNENSYQHTWPLKIFFHCAIPSQEGGETPLADCRNIFARISPEIRERFRQKKWMYMRNFGDGFGLPWQTVFQTEDKTVVEEHCRRHHIKVEWKDGNRLRTYAVRPAIEKHPQTGEEVWFNHATFFHITTLAPSIREALLAEFAEQDLPYNTYYGDGTPIESEVLEELREAYGQEKVMFGWEQGDVLMVDNMMVAHGRSPYVGERKVLVGMAEPFSRQNSSL
jgi:alpha-ketoglutarate-dependent taurine dioxygenase